MKQSFVWYELSWPRDLGGDQVTSWLYSLSGYSSSHGVRFVTIATAGKIRHFLVLQNSNANLHIKSLKTFLPDIELDVVDEPAIDLKLTAKTLMTSKNRTLQTRLPEIVAHSLINGLSVLAPGEKVIVVWLLGKRFSPKLVPTGTVSSYSSNWIKATAEAALYDPKPLDSQSLNSMRDKKDYPSWQANLYIAVQADTKRRQMALIKRVGGTLRAADAPGVRLGTRYTARQLQIARIPWLWPLNINPQELTGLLGWPLGDQSLPGISRIRSKYLPLPESRSKFGKVVAQTRDGDNIRISTQDSSLHSHILGPTGVGKSTLLLNLVTQDIKANRAVIVVDPKGDLIQDIMSRIPEERTDDLIVLDPSDASLQVGLNPLSVDQSPSLVADNILSIFKGLYASYFGPRTQDILHSGLLTLARNKDTNLCMLPLLYTNPEFRRSMVNKLNDPLGLGSFWNWYDSLSEAERVTVTAPVMNKIRPFLLRPAMRRVIGQSKPKLDIAETLNSNKILLVNLAKGTLGQETSQLFGSLVVSQIWQAIQTRANTPIGQRKPAFVYVDEIQDYLHLPTDIGDVLAQSRSYGVGMTLAHQHLGQLPSDLRAGILSNARNKVCFQLSHEDAFAIAKSSNILTPGDFENLERYHVYAQLVNNGSVQSWVSGVTLEPPLKISNPYSVFNTSRKNYGVNANEVEDSLIGINNQLDSEENPAILSRAIEVGVPK